MDRADTLFTRPRVLLANAVLVAIPFLWVAFPPATDMPQHLAQLRALSDLLHGSALYTFQPLVPYSAVYALFGALWLLCPLELLPRLAPLSLALCWTLAVHGLAAWRNRSCAGAVVASLFAFSHLAYWGFASFELGACVFLCWLELTRAGPQPMERRRALALALGSAALYLTHALWFAAGLVWLGVQGLLFARGARQWRPRALAVLPTLAVALAWFPRYARRTEREFDGSAVWSAMAERFSLHFWTDGTLGGLRGPLEPLTLLLLAGVLAGALALRRATWDRELLGAALLLLGSAFVLPDRFMNTVRFAPRFIPAGWALLALASPIASRARPRTLALALAGLAAFVAATTVQWRRFEQDELAGFRQAIQTIPPNSRVLGLELLPNSKFIKGEPFRQLPAYAQVLRGGTMNSSFCDYPHFPIVYRNTAHPWTQGLEEEPRALQERDLAFFDVALVHGQQVDQDALAERWRWSALSPPAPWRAFRVKPAR